jgi:hypothetical protein
MSHAYQASRIAPLAAAKPMRLSDLVYAAVVAVCVATLMSLPTAPEMDAAPVASPLPVITLLAAAPSGSQWPAPAVSADAAPEAPAPTF